MSYTIADLKSKLTDLGINTNTPGLVGDEVSINAYELMNENSGAIAAGAHSSALLLYIKLFIIRIIIYYYIL